MSRRGRSERSDSTRTLDNALGSYLRSQGHEEAWLLGEVCKHWKSVVGPDVALHVVPRALRGDELVVGVDQPGWATQFVFLAEDVLGRLEAQLGRHVAARVKVTVRPDPGVE